jgi:xylulokinase
MRHDPPQALAIGASGRENFLADADGVPLTNAVMGADIRGAEFEVIPADAPQPEAWCLSAGHLRERMDPIFRLAWWRKHHPELFDKATYFLGWHDFLTLRLCGQVATDPSTASRYAIYDLATRAWSPQRLAHYDLPNTMLPNIPPWATPLGTIRHDLAHQLGLPTNLQIVLGGHDVNCAALGAGAIADGEVCLISGSYENVLVITSQLPTAPMLLRGLSVMPHPGSAGYSVLAVCPTGNAVLNWARNLTHLALEDSVQQLDETITAPSPVMALPYLSGAMTYWQNGRNARGTLLGLTLATTPIQIVQALMESIAYDHVNTFGLLKQEGIHIQRVRAVGGGARWRWWTQLKADLTQLPIEIVQQDECGTLGAAILAGAGIGLYDDITHISRQFAGTAYTHEPNPHRAQQHHDRLQTYHHLVPLLIKNLYNEWH